MITAATATCVFLALLGIAQLSLVRSLAVEMRNHRRPDKLGSDAPRVAVLLAIRGADPHLAAGLRTLMQQDYPNYELRIVVDSQQDPGWEVVQQAITETSASNVYVRELQNRPPTCSLHCASLIQLVNDLDESHEVFVLCDSDIVAHPTWLLELVAPIVADQADITSGHRWYVPPAGRLGSLVRRIWNVGAIVGMHAFRIPWGGSLAGRVADLRRADLTERWRRALAVDAPIAEAWRGVGERVLFVPSLIIVNTEECHLAGCLNFITRQLLWTRLYQPPRFWQTTVLHALSTTGALIAALVLLLFGLWLQAWSVVAWTAAGYCIYILSMGTLISYLGFHVRRAVPERFETIQSPRLVQRIKALLAIPLTQLLQTTAVLQAAFTRQIHWRGIVYTIRGPFDVQLQEDRPFEQRDHNEDSLASL